MNARTELLQNSLPLICAGLGDKLNVKIKVQGSQAQTDGKTITIPDFKVATKEDKDAVLGFASHEAAHIKFNSWKGISHDEFQRCTAMRKAMWNIFEDLRIESEMIKAMVGTRKWIDQIWINRQKEGSRPAVNSGSGPTSILQDYLLFTCRVKYRKQTHLQPYLDAATDAFIDVLGWKLQMQLDDVLSEHLPKLTSSRKAFDLAIQVEQLIKNHEPEEPQQPEPEQPKPDPSNEESTDGENGDSEKSEPNSSESDNGKDEEGSSTSGNDGESEGEESASNGSSNSEGSKQGESQESEGDAKGSSGTESESSSSSESSNASEGEGDSSQESSSKSNQTSSGAPLNTPSAEDVKKAIEALAKATDDDFEDDMEQFVSQMAKLAQANDAQSNVGMPDAWLPKDYMQNLSSYQIKLGKSLVSDVKRNSNMLTAKLQGLVQEDMRVRAKTKDSGQKLNTKVLHRVAVGNSKVFKSKAKRKEVDTIVEIMVDNSGSMRNRRTSKGETLISEARKAQLSLALALDKLQGVSVTASAFPTAHPHSTNVIELLSEGESVKKLATRLGFVNGNGDNTPSASAMWHSLRKVVESNKQRKIILFVTDGSPNGDQVEALSNLVTKAEKNGVVVIGIAIGEIAHYKTSFYKFFSNAIFIQDAAELKTQMFKVAQNLISG